MNEQTKTPLAALIARLEEKLKGIRAHRDQTLANHNVAIGQCHELEATISELKSLNVANSVSAPRLAPLKLEAAASAEAGPG